MTRSARPARRVGCVLKTSVTPSTRHHTHAGRRGQKGEGARLEEGQESRLQVLSPRPKLFVRPPRSRNCDLRTGAPPRRRKLTTRTRRATATTTTRRTTGARGGVEITRSIPDSPVDVAQARNRRRKLQLLRRRCDRRGNSLFYPRVDSPVHPCAGPETQARSS